MDDNLKQRYGYCILPRNSLLYHGTKNSNTSDQLFFCTKYVETSPWGPEVQVWKTRRAIELLFLARNIDHDAKITSSLPDLYSQLYPSESRRFSDLGVKQDQARRDPFGRRLFTEFSVPGWLTSIEDGQTGYEICLFNRNRIYRDLELIATTERQFEVYYKDTLKRMRFFPTQSFMDESRKCIQVSLSYEEHGRNPFRVYARMIKSWIDEYVQQGNSLECSKHYYYDLRQKLKI